MGFPPWVHHPRGFPLGFTPLGFPPGVHLARFTLLGFPLGFTPLCFTLLVSPWGSPPPSGIHLRFPLGFTGFIPGVDLPRFPLGVSPWGFPFGDPLPLGVRPWGPPLWGPPRGKKRPAAAMGTQAAKSHKKKRDPEDLPDSDQIMLPLKLVNRSKPPQCYYLDGAGRHIIMVSLASQGPRFKDILAQIGAAIEAGDIKTKDQAVPHFRFIQRSVPPHAPKPLASAIGRFRNCKDGRYRNWWFRNWKVPQLEGDALGSSPQ